MRSVLIVLFHLVLLGPLVASRRQGAKLDFLNPRRKTHHWCPEEYKNCDDLFCLPPAWEANKPPTWACCDWGTGMYCPNHKTCHNATRTCCPGEICDDECMYPKSVCCGWGDGKHCPEGSVCNNITRTCCEGEACYNKCIPKGTVCCGEGVGYCQEGYTCYKDDEDDGRWKCLSKTEKVEKLGDVLKDDEDDDAELEPSKGGSGHGDDGAEESEDDDPPGRHGNGDGRGKGRGKGRGRGRDKADESDRGGRHGPKRKGNSKGGKYPDDADFAHPFFEEKESKADFDDPFFND